jgi:hypothetical protein
LLVPTLVGHIAWFATGMLILSFVALVCWWRWRASP